MPYRSLTSLAASSLLVLTGLQASASAAQPKGPEHRPISAAPTEGEQSAAASPDDLAWIRVEQSDDRVLQLQLAAREYEPADGANGPMIAVFGAVHIGDATFYSALQRELDAYDLVLYEGVTPPGAERETPTTAEGKKQLTDDRLRLLATVYAQHKARVEAGAEEGVGDGPADAYRPESMEALVASLQDHARALKFVRAASVDAWGNDMVLMPADNASAMADFASPGPDGELGTDDDRRFSEQAELSPAEVGESPGIQAQLARALDLTFQLDEMNEDGAHWRNADMSLRQVQDSLKEKGADGGFLLGSLDGSGLTAQIAGFLLGFVERIPGMQPRAKMMLMDMLAMADLELSFSQIDGGEELLEVIIDERNQVVIDRLREALAERVVRDRIAIIYGAGHMPDLDERLREQLGYEPVRTRWNTAISLDLDAAGISRLERAQMRSQMRRQMAMMRQQAERQREMQGGGQ